MTAGEFLPAGVPVVITEVRGLHVLVRPAEDAPAARGGNAGCAADGPGRALTDGGRPDRILIG